METERVSHFQEYQYKLTRVASGELVIPGWEAMSDRERMVALAPDYAEDLDAIARVKYQPLAGKG